MFDDLQINGGRKVLRRPSLSVYDERKPRSPAVDPAYDATFDTRFDADAPRTHGRDKSLLVALGVDGDAPLAQARINAGLDADPNDIRLTWQNADPNRRGTGNTAKQLMALSEGDAFIVAHGSQRRYTLDLLRHLRGAEFAKSIVIVIAGDEHRLMGRRGTASWDHALYDLVSAGVYERTYEFVRDFNAWRRPANDNHQIAAVAA